MLRRLTLALALSTALTAAGAQPAQAGPLVAAVVAFAATPIGGFVVSTVLGFVASEAATLIKSWVGGNQQTAIKPTGMRLSLSASGIDPQAFVMGPWATAGSLNYWGSWGDDGGTPNAYLTLELILSDLPQRTLTGAIVGDTRITIPDMSGARPTAQGWPVAQFNDGTKDNLWISYRDGSQTSADAFLRATFGGDADRPYTADMVGYGRACAVVTMRVNQMLFPGGRPNIIWELSGIDEYDPAQDSTVGGSGAHRANDATTWRPSANLAVHLHSVLRGIWWGNEWVYGLQESSPGDLPTSAWLAAINECNASVALAAGGTEPQFWGGLEVTVDRPAADVIAEFLKGCAGKLAEIGGVYKPLVGPPPVPVYSFTDANIVITRGHGIDPFPVLEDTFNAAQGSYPEPAANWASKDAPAVTVPALETEDGGRRMSAPIQFAAVKSSTQVQRLLTAAVKDGRNFRRPSGVLPPDASDLEPLDSVGWTSASEGYAAKQFLISAIDDEPTYLQAVSLLETDPAAFDWDAGTDEQPSSVGFLSGRRPPTQVIIAPSVTAVVIPDASGAPRRVGVRFGWDGTVDDVRAVGMQVRLPDGEGGGNILLSESTDNVAAGEATYSSNAILPAQSYQGREIYYPRSSRPSTWTDWLDFTTDNILLTGSDLADATIAASKFAFDVQNILGPIIGDIYSRLAANETDLGDMAQSVAGLSALHQKQITGLSVRNVAAAAQILRVAEVAVSAHDAVASLSDQVTAVLGPIGADAGWKAQVTVDELTGTSTLSFVVRATNGNFTGTAALQLGASVTESGEDSYVNVMADRLNFITTAEDFVVVPFFTAVDPVAGTAYAAIVNLRIDNLKALDGTTFELDGGTTNTYGEPFLRIG